MSSSRVATCSLAKSSSRFTFCASFSFISSFSSFLLSSRAARVRKARAEESTTSPDAPARTGQARGRVGVPREVPSAAVTSLRQGLQQDARPLPRWRLLQSPKGRVRLVNLHLPCARRLLCPYAGVRPRPHITAVMQGRGELQCDGLPLVSKPRAQPVAAAFASQSQRNHGRVQHRSHPLVLKHHGYTNKGTRV